MKLSEFIKNLNILVAERPELLGFDVITAKDDEGNGFDSVHFEPTVGRYEDREFGEEGTPNAVCVN